MSLPARFRGTCPECGGRWSPEDPIRTNESGQWVHGACPDDIDTTPTHPVCTACWLTHPEGACDRG